MDPNISKLQSLIKELLPLGEDAKDLQFWTGIFEDLSPEEQNTVLNTLGEELAALKKL